MVIEIFKTVYFVKYSNVGIICSGELGSSVGSDLVYSTHSQIIKKMKYIFFQLYNIL